jgi:hypothetical protein
LSRSYREDSACPAPAGDLLGDPVGKSRIAPSLVSRLRASALSKSPAEKSFPYLVASLPPYVLFSKPFSCNIYGTLSYVLQTTDLRQAYLPTNSFRCNTYRKHGGQGRLWSFDVSTRFNACLRGVSFPFTFLRTLWHGAKLNPFVFRRFRTLCQKHPGWGYPLSLLSKPLPVPKACIGRTIGAGNSPRQAIPRSKFRRSKYVYYVGGCDG